MKKFIGRKVYIRTCLGGMEGSSGLFKGVVTSVDDEFLCLDDKVYVVIKYIMSVEVK